MSLGLIAVCGTGILDFSQHLRHSNLSSNFGSQVTPERADCDNVWWRSIRGSHCSMCSWGEQACSSPPRALRSTYHTWNYRTKYFIDDENKTNHSAYPGNQMVVVAVQSNPYSICKICAKILLKRALLRKLQSLGKKTLIQIFICQEKPRPVYNHSQYSHFSHT